MTWVTVKRRPASTLGADAHVARLGRRVPAEPGRSSAANRSTVVPSSMAGPLATTLQASPPSRSYPSTSTRWLGRDRSGRLRALRGAEDDRSIVDDVVDREDVRVLTHADGESSHLARAQQCPAPSSLSSTRSPVVVLIVVPSRGVRSPWLRGSHGGRGSSAGRMRRPLTSEARSLIQCAGPPTHGSRSKCATSLGSTSTAALLMSTLHPPWWLGSMKST